MGISDQDAKDIVRRMSLITRWLLWLFRRRLNRELFSPLLNRAYERRVISSEQLHALHHHCDWTQNGVMGSL